MPENHLVNEIMKHLKIYYKHGEASNLRDFEEINQLLKERQQFRPYDEHAKWDVSSFPKKQKESYYRDYIKETLTEIVKFDNGRKLLSSFLEKMQNTKINFLIIFSSDSRDITSFSPKTSHRSVWSIPEELNSHIMLNMWDGKRVTTQKDGKVYVYSISGLLKSRLGTSHETSSNSSSEIQIDDDPKELVEVGAGLTPFYITFAHELIHAIRYFKNEDEQKQVKSISDPYADQYRKRAKSLYPDAEEERTVLSSGDVSELVLRMEAKERIRYPYSFNGETFYEPSSSIIRNISFYPRQNTGALEHPLTPDVLKIEINRLPIKPLPVDKKISDDYTINSSSNDAFEGVSASATSIAPMPEHVKQGIIYTQFRELPKLYKRYRSIDIASDIIRDLSAIYEKNPNSFTNSVGNRIHPAISIVQERMNRSDYLVKALDYVNKVKKDTIDINEVIRKKEPEHQWIIRAIAKKRISPDNFVSSTSFSPSSSSSSSSDMPLPSITAKTENIKKELARKLARAVYTKIMLEHNYIGEKSNNPSAYAVTEGIRRLTQNLKQISTPTVKPMSLEQFKKLMHFYSNNDAIEHRRKMVNVVTKWYLKYGHSLFPKT